MYHEQTLAIRQKQLPSEHTAIAASLNNIGLVYWKMNHFECAHDYYQRSLAIRKKLLPPEHNLIVQSLINIAHVLHDQGNLDTALKYYSEALTIQKIDFDPTDYHDLVDRLNENSRLQNKDRVARPAYNVMSSASTPERTSQEPCFVQPAYTMSEVLEMITDSIRTPSLENNVCPIDEIIHALKDGTDPQVAFNLWKQTLNKYEEFDENHPYVQGLLWIIGDTITYYCLTDADGEALRFYEKALFLLENSVPQIIDTKNISILCLNHIGSIHERGNNFELALDYFARALKLQQQSQKAPTEIAHTLRSIGVAHMHLGNYNLALTSFNDALELLEANSTDPNSITVKLTCAQINEAKKAINSTTRS